MGHTNSTPNIGLPQFIGTDKPTWLGDVNGAMSAIDTKVGSIDAAIATTDAKADNAVADASGAVTTATNAVNTAGAASTTATQANNLATQALTVANNTADLCTDQIVPAVSANKTAIGTLSDLTTTDKSNLVAAINEVAQGGGGGGVVETVLWSNPDPTQVFAGQAVTLSDSITNYDLIKVQVLDRNDRAGMYEAYGVVSLITTGTSFVDVGFVAGSTMNGEHGRRANFTDNTTITFDNGYSGGVAGSNYGIPYKVIGIKN